MQAVHFIAGKLHLIFSFTMEEHGNPYDTASATINADYNYYAIDEAECQRRYLAMVALLFIFFVRLRAGGACS